MEILKWLEQNDGSAKLEMEMTDEEKNFLIEYAVNDILRKKLEELKDGTI